MKFNLEMINYYTQEMKGDHRKELEKHLKIYEEQVMNDELELQDKSSSLQIDLKYPFV
jgi:hypothetical protein